MSTANTPTEQISIDLSPLQLKEVKALLGKYLPNTTVWAYGSRVRWSARPNSDLDIVAFASPAQAAQVSLLREAFEESNLPFTVDFFVWDTVPEKFRENIQREYIELQSGEAEKEVRAGEWQHYLFEDCMDAIIDYRGKTPKKTIAGIPLITAKIIKNGAIQQVNEFIAEEDYDSWMRRGIPEPGDVVLTTEAPLGEVAQLDNRKIALAQRVITLRGKKGFLDNTFLKYLLLSKDVQHQLDGRGTGTTVKGIKQAELRKLELTIPEYETQKSIAHIIGTLDQKIKLNHQTNQTLEKMAQALFKSWFVDFDPVIDNALAAGKPIPDELQERAQGRQQQLAKPDHKPLLDDIRQLFSSEFELTEELGWVPKHWEAGATENIAFTNPVSWSKKTAPEQVEYVDLANAKNGYIQDTISYSFEDAPSRARRKLDKGDTIIGLVRPGNRSFAYIQQSGLTGSTGFAVLKPRSDSVRAYLYFHLTRNDVINEFARLADGAAYPAIRPEVVSTFACLLPPDSVLSLYQNKVEGFLGKMAVSSLENRQLEKIRETLLPKLISGELRLPSDALADTTPQAATAKV